MSDKAWYVAPAVQQFPNVDWSDVENPVVVSLGFLGPLDGSEHYINPEISCYAYSSFLHKILVVAPSSLTVPSDWVSKTKEEAIVYFTQVTGSPPTGGELD